MATEVEIANLALMEIGIDPISSMTEASPAARRISLAYPSARDKVLRDHAWNFATQIDALAEKTNVSVSGWAHVYAYPSKSVFVRKVYNAETFDRRDEQSFKELFLKSENVKVICSNLEEAIAEYTYQMTDPSLFDPSFVKALSLYLASCVAGALTTDKNLSVQMFQKYQAEIAEAKTSNTSEGREIPDRPSGYETSRG